MKKQDMRSVALLFRSQHGAAGRRQLRRLGVSVDVEAAKVQKGEWERVTSQVVRVVGAPVSAEQALMVALIAGGPTAVASHRSAAWLWRLLDAPVRPEVTVHHTRNCEPGPYVIHRTREPPEPFMHRGFAVTNPLRSLVDLASVADADTLDDAVDRAVARRLVTVRGLAAEVERLSRRGRPGPGYLRRSLVRRGLTEGPAPSVLEARFHRLLQAAGIKPIGVEVVAGPDGEYRVDCQLDPLVVVEVDGHTYHSTPEQKHYDERRRATLRLEGIFVLVFDWRDVTSDARRVAAECRLALARHGSARRIRMAD